MSKTVAKLASYTDKPLAQCSNLELFNALVHLVQDTAKNTGFNQGKKKLYYISAEFLIGKLLSNNLINLGLYDNIKEERGPGMKVRVDISADYKEPYAVIYTDKVTDEIQRMIDLFSTSETPVTALQNEEDLIVLQPKEIFMVRVENGETIIYGEKDKYRTRKRLYEIGRQLGKQFMQISRTTLINLSYMDRIEPGFGGTLLLKLRNGCKDYVSRRYLPEFKKYLGL